MGFSGGPRRRAGCLTRDWFGARHAVRTVTGSGMDLIVNASEEPVERAGYANIGLPLTAITAVLAYLGTRVLGFGLSASLSAVMAVLAAGAGAYSRALARVSLDAGTLSR